jgi:hypothetical protein
VDSEPDDGGPDQSPDQDLLDRHTSM